MKKIEKFNLVQEMRDYFKLSPYLPIMQWIDKEITYVDDVSAERDKPDFSLYPYQVDVIKTWEDLNVRKHVTFVSCEQMRKNKCLASWTSF